MDFAAFTKVDKLIFGSNEPEDSIDDTLMKRLKDALRTILLAQAVAKTVFSLHSHFSHHLVFVLEWM